MMTKRVKSIYEIDDEMKRMYGRGTWELVESEQVLGKIFLLFAWLYQHQTEHMYQLSCLEPDLRQGVKYNKKQHIRQSQ